MSRLEHDGKIVIVKNCDCCTNMVGLLHIIEIEAFVDFGESRCPKGHNGIFLDYPFGDYYEVKEK